jgi:hypothetical protein
LVGHAHVLGDVADRDVGLYVCLTTATPEELRVEDKVLVSVALYHFGVVGVVFEVHASISQKVRPLAPIAIKSGMSHGLPSIKSRS